MSVLGVYLPILWFVVVAILSVQVVRTLYDHRFDVSAFLSSEISVIELQKPVAFDLGWKSMAILALVIWYLNHRDKPVYLIDFAVFEPPEDWKLSHDQLMDIMGKQGCFTEDSLNFLSRFMFVCLRLCVSFAFFRRFSYFFFLFARHQNFGCDRRLEVIDCQILSFCDFFHTVRPAHALIVPITHLPLLLLLCFLPLPHLTRSLSFSSLLSPLLPS